jgi:hypothetical protein
METSGSAASARRTFLQRMAAVLGGVAGVAACSSAAGGPAVSTAQGTPPPTAGSSGPLLLRGAGRPLAAAPVGGAVGTGPLGVRGQLTYASTGAVAGRFRSQALDPSSPGGLEIQHLELGEGSLYAVGARRGTPRAYAVLGGTGRYAGARGTLEIRELADAGARQDLELSLTLS